MTASYNYVIYSAGVIYVLTSSKFNLIASDFEYNSAQENSVLEVLGGNQDEYSNISACSFAKNAANLNTISLQYALVTIENSNFQNNKAIERSKNIFAGFSTVKITNTIFRDESKSTAATLAASDNTQGSFIFAILDVNLYVAKCYFYNGIAN